MVLWINGELLKKNWALIYIIAIYQFAKNELTQKNANLVIETHSLLLTSYMKIYISSSFFFVFLDGFFFFFIKSIYVPRKSDKFITCPWKIAAVIASDCRGESNKCGYYCSHDYDKHIEESSLRLSHDK